MKFGPVPVREAEGAILAHSLRIGATALKKGRLLSAGDVEAIVAAGIGEITVARLDAGDIREDPAGERIARTATASTG
jgi:molybdenum cofactor cytidylyltransferase